MKLFARIACLVMASVVVVFLAGCATPRTARTYRYEQGGSRVPLYDFQVVSSSSDRRLSTAELDQLEQGAQKFIASQGYLSRSGEYVIRVDLPARSPDQPAEWVLVKLTSLPAPTFTLAETYPTAGDADYYYPGGFAYGYDPFGYDDPFGYGYPWDFPRTSPYRPRPDDNHHHGDHHPGDQPGRYAGGGHDGHGAGPSAPGGWQPGHDRRDRTAGYAPHAPDYGRGRDGGSGRGSSSGGGRPGGGSSYTPPSPPRHETSPAPAPAARQEASRDNSTREDKAR